MAVIFAMELWHFYKCKLLQHATVLLLLFSFIVSFAAFCSLWLYPWHCNLFC